MFPWHFQLQPEGEILYKSNAFSFPLKKNYACQSLTDGARLKNVPPSLDLTRILKSYIKGMIEESLLKNKSGQYHVR